MHRIAYHRRAARALRNIPQQRSRQILEDLAELAKLEDPRTHGNARAMQGEMRGAYRLRIGDYRAIFELHDIDGESCLKIIFVTAIGPRGGIYG